MMQCVKMDGLGNDFVIIDGRDNPVCLDKSQITNIANRNNKITKGCDQIIILESSDSANVFMRIYNADGGQVDACGNATRAVAKLLAREASKTEITIQTNAAILHAEINGENISVNMGQPQLAWQDIPLSHQMDTLRLDIIQDNLEYPTAVGIGNPHMVFFVDDIDEIDLKTHGPILEHHKFYPESANIGIAEIKNRNNINLRVFERGVGETKACGTGACAAAVAAIRRGLCDEDINVKLQGGTLNISWHQKQDVVMTGATNLQYKFNIG